MPMNLLTEMSYEAQSEASIVTVCGRK